MAIESSLQDVLNVLPVNIVSRLEVLIVLLQALGGVFVVYVIFTIVRFFIARKEEKMLEEIRDDVKFIRSRMKKAK